MAAWISGAPINYASHSHQSFPVCFTVNQPTSRLRLLMRNSSTGDAESIATESVSPLEVPKGAPSLISAVNVEKALRGIAITDEDHYGRLGVERGCSSDEVRVAYENKVLDVMNENQEEVIGIQRRLDLLKESYDILCAAEERRLYDWSLERSDNPDRYMWPYEVDKTPVVSTESPPPQQPEDVAPTRLLDYSLGMISCLSRPQFFVINKLARPMRPCRQGCEKTLRMMKGC